MLAHVRNNILITGLILSVIILIGLIVFLCLFLITDKSITDRLLFIPQYWWFWYGNQTVNTDFVLWSIAVISSILVFCTGCGIVLFRLYKKIISPEIFFFTFFLFSFSFEGFRIFFLYTLAGIPVYMSMIFSRVVIFGRFFGLFSLFIASLYALEIKYQNFGMLLGGIFLVSLIIAYNVLFDSSILLTQGIYKLGDESGTFIINMALGLLAVVNFIIASIRRNQRFWYIFLACVIVLVGRELFLFIANPVTGIIGLGLLFFGTIFFYRQIERIYLWF